MDRACKVGQRSGFGASDGLDSGPHERGLFVIASSAQRNCKFQPKRHLSIHSGASQPISQAANDHPPGPPVSRRLSTLRGPTSARSSLCSDERVLVTGPIIGVDPSWTTSCFGCGAGLRTTVKHIFRLLPPRAVTFAGCSVHSSYGARRVSRIVVLFLVVLTGCQYTVPMRRSGLLHAPWSHLIEDRWLSDYRPINGSLPDDTATHKGRGQDSAFVQAAVF